MRAHCLAKCLNVARRPGCFPKISTQLPGNCGGITLKPIHWWESSTAQSCSASLGANVDEPPGRNIEPSSSARQWRGARRARRRAIRCPARNTGIWVGWSGEMTERFTGQIALSEDEGIKTATIDLEEQDIDEYYNGYANRTLWPLFHYRIDLAEYNRPFAGGNNREIGRASCGERVCQ